MSISGINSKVSGINSPGRQFRRRAAISAGVQHARNLTRASADQYRASWQKAIADALPTCIVEYFRRRYASELRALRGLRRGINSRASGG